MDSAGRGSRWGKVVAGPNSADPACRSQRGKAFRSPRELKGEKPKFIPPRSAIFAGGPSPRRTSSRKKERRFRIRKEGGETWAIGPRCTSPVSARGCTSCREKHQVPFELGPAPSESADRGVWPPVSCRGVTCGMLRQRSPRRYGFRVALQSGQVITCWTGGYTSIRPESNPQCTHPKPAPRPGITIVEPRVH